MVLCLGLPLSVVCRRSVPILIRPIFVHLYTSLYIVLQYSRTYARFMCSSSLGLFSLANPPVSLIHYYTSSLGASELDRATLPVRNGYWGWSHLALVLAPVPLLWARSAQGPGLDAKYGGSVAEEPTRGQPHPPRPICQPLSLC